MWKNVRGGQKETGGSSCGGSKGQMCSNLDEAASGGQHADAAVLKLGLAEPLDVDDRGDPERVKADVTSHGAVQSLGLREERNGLGLRLHLHACKNIATTKTSMLLLFQRLVNSASAIPHLLLPHARTHLNSSLWLPTGQVCGVSPTQMLPHPSQ